MKRIILLLIPLIFLLSSCSFESYFPQEEMKNDSFTEYKGLYEKAVDDLKSLNKELLITDSSVYQHELAKDLSGLYMVDFSENTAMHIENQTMSELIKSAGVKMIDTVIYNGEIICSFGFTTPKQNFDWGYYFVLNDEPIYLGDPDVTLSPKENGYEYHYKVSSLTSISYYTEKISDNFFYYEIN